MRHTGLFALIVLVACSTPPDLESGSVKVWWNGHAPLTQMIPAMDILYQNGLAVCPEPEKLKKSWCANVYWQDDPFMKCAGYTGPKFGYHGCQPVPGDCTVWVGWKPTIGDTALPEEVAHYIWEVCFGNSGEGCAVAYPDGGYDICASAEYDHFVSVAHDHLRGLK